MGWKRSLVHKVLEIIPLKGYVLLDQGSLSTDKGIIISLYEQGVSPREREDYLFKVEAFVKAVLRICPEKKKK